RLRSPAKPEWSTKCAERRSRIPRRNWALPPPSKEMKRNPSPKDESLTEKGIHHHQEIIPGGQRQQEEATLKIISDG
ncbi:hypothetical protein Tco_0391671, partial [Tanacetum coccineum]